jgi:hypothetical protein
MKWDGTQRHPKKITRRGSGRITLFNAAAPPVMLVMSFYAIVLLVVAEALLCQGARLLCC